LIVVLDASVVLEVLLGTAAGRALAPRVLDPERVHCCPELLDLEVLQVLRRYVRAGELGEARARQALDDLAALRLARYPHAPLVDRIWALRANLTAYDAAYVALAEALEATLLTRDRSLASAPGHSTAVELI
jgi:predicted nucleic acid-binding protein